MANDITNELTLANCSHERCYEILEAIKMDERDVGAIDFNKIIPQPEGLYMGDLGTEELRTYKDNNWYDWRIENWGTKWNSYGYNNGLAYYEDKNQIYFLSANSSALKIVEALSRQYPDVLFDLRYADEDLGYNVGTVSIMAGEYIDENLPKNGTLEAQELAADIMEIDLTFDVQCACGYVPSLYGNYYEYCEGVHISQSFQCDISLGHPVVLCYDEENGKIWMEFCDIQGEDRSKFREVEKRIQDWGIHPCKSWADYNGYVQCLGDDAMAVAYHEEGGGMMLC